MSRKVFRRGVTTTSTTLSDIGEVGDERTIGPKRYRLVYTVATQAAKAILALDSTDAALASFQVQVAPASTSPVFGVNDTGATVAGSTYLWALVEGPFVADSTVLGNVASVAAEAILALDSTMKLGQFTTVASDQNRHQLGHSITSWTSVDSTQGTPTVWLKGMG